MKILLAEDEHDLSRALTAVLEHNDYKVTAVYNGVDAVEEAKKSAYDCFIFDIMMPQKDGITALSEIRDAGDTTPAIFLTAKSEMNDKIAGLDAGADDYLTKPFAMKEFLARVRALVRRGGNDDSLDKIMYAGLVLNGEDLSLSSENTVRLSLKEYELMREFMKNPGRELATDYLLWKIWNNEQNADEDTVWLYVSYLKNKLRSIVTAVTINGDKGGAFTLTE